MTHRSGGMTLESDGWIRLLNTLERIASSLERITDLVEKAAEEEALGGGETARLQASYESGLKKGRLQRATEDPGCTPPPSGESARR